MKQVTEFLSHYF